MYTHNTQNEPHTCTRHSHAHLQVSDGTQRLNEKKENLSVFCSALFFLLLSGFYFSFFSFPFFLVFTCALQGADQWQTGLFLLPIENARSSGSSGLYVWENVPYTITSSRILRVHCRRRGQSYTHHTHIEIELQHKQPSNDDTNPIRLMVKRAVVSN